MIPNQFCMFWAEKLKGCIFQPNKTMKSWRAAQIYMQQQLFESTNELKANTPKYNIWQTADNVQAQIMSCGKTQEWVLNKYLVWHVKITEKRSPHPPTAHFHAHRNRSSAVACLPGLTGLLALHQYTCTSHWMMDVNYVILPHSREHELFRLPEKMIHYPEFYKVALLLDRRAAVLFQ